MMRETLLDFFDERLRSDAEFCVHDDGYRIHRYSYGMIRRGGRRLRGAARVSRGRRRRQGPVLGREPPRVGHGLLGLSAPGRCCRADRLRASASSCVGRQLVDARVLLVGDDVEPASYPISTVWRLAELSETAGAHAPPAAAALAVHTPTRDDIAEIIFTSGATSEPKGVVITPPQRASEHRPGRTRGTEVSKVRTALYPLRFLNLLPLKPHVSVRRWRPSSADAPGCLCVHARLQPLGHRAPDPQPPDLGARLRPEDSGRAAKTRAADRPGGG